MVKLSMYDFFLSVCVCVYVTVNEDLKLQYYKFQ